MELCHILDTDINNADAFSKSSDVDSSNYTLMVAVKHEAITMSNRQSKLIGKS